MKRRVRISKPQSKGEAIAGLIESSVSLLEHLRPHEGTLTDLNKLKNSVQDGLHYTLENAYQFIPEEERQEVSRRLQATILVSRSLFRRTDLEQLIKQLNGK